LIASRNGARQQFAFDDHVAQSSDKRVVEGGALHRPDLALGSLRQCFHLALCLLVRFGRRDESAVLVQNEEMRA
jgi:hypothetical protein